MMDGWNVNYHRERLESYSGKKWIPRPQAGDSVRSRKAVLDRSRRKVTHLQATLRMLALTQYVAVALICSAVAAGILGWFATTGPITALAVPSSIYLVLGFAGRMLVIDELDDAEDAALGAEDAYEKALDKVVNS